MNGDSKGGWALKKRVGVLMYQTSTSKGQELVAQRMVRDFISLGQEAYLITSVYHDGVEVIPTKSLRKSRGYIVVDDPELGIPVIRVDSYVLKWPRRRICFRDFVQVLQKIVDEFKLNVVITHSTLWNGPEEVAKFISWRRYMRDLGGYKDPIVFCQMSHFQEPSPRRYSLVERTFRMAWNRLSLSPILKTANLVLVVTPIEKNAKVMMGADSKKCLLFQSGVNEELFLRFAAADVTTFLRRHKIPNDVKLVSYLGTLEERKNPMGVLKVAELLKDRSDIHFMIAGRGDSHYAGRVKEKSSSLPNVTFLGEIDDKEKILLIKSSHINILLSRSEALGLAQLEFMYAGVPVITSGVGGQSWLVRNGREGVHTDGPDDAEGAARAVLDLVDHHRIWNRLSVNAREKAKNLTSSSAMRELDDAITEELVKESGLKLLPPEARKTLAEPEHVSKTWSEGSWGAVATDRRLFIKKGRFSRKVAEIPYTSVDFIEHTRRYPWTTLLARLLPAIFFSLNWPFKVWGQILNPAIGQWLGSIGITTEINGIFSIAFTLASILIGISGVFALALEPKTGTNLYCLGREPIYIPHKFSEIVTLIRKVQDEQQRRSSQVREDVRVRS